MGIYLLGLVSVGVMLGFFPRFVSTGLTIGWFIVLGLSLFLDPGGGVLVIGLALGMLVLVPARVILTVRTKPIAHRRPRRA